MVGNIKSRAVKLKILTFILLLLCVLICAPPITKSGLSANGDVVPIKLQSEDQTIHRGQTFDVDVELSDNSGILTLFLVVKFDHSVFNLTNVQQVKQALGSLNMEYSGSGFDYVDARTGGFNLMWDGSSKDYTNGKIVKLTFESLITAPIGNYTIEFDIDTENTTSEYQVPANIEPTSAQITLVEGAYIVVWHDWDGTPVENTNITGHPYNQLTGGYEYASEEGLTLADYPDNPTRAQDAMYSYEFSGWKGAVWHGDAPEGSSVIYYIADYTLTPQTYVVWYFVDGYGDENAPDGTIVADEAFDAKEVAYGENIDEKIYPFKHNYTFYGWYRDQNFTQKLASPLMPAHDVNLYGYFKFNIRETDIPEIKLEYRETQTNGEGEDIAYVDVYVTKNYGLSSLMITLSEYDKTAFTFCGFEKGEIFRQMSFFTTNYENDVYPDNFNFSWNNSYNNSYELGRLLVLKFKVKENAPVGAYEVKMTCNNQNTTYNLNGEEWYSNVDFINTKIPIGETTSWSEHIPGTTEDIEVISEVPVPYNIELVIRVVTQEADALIDSDKLEEVLLDDYMLHAVYEIYFQQNATRLTQEQFTQYFGEQNVTVKIKLSTSQKTCKHLTIYHIDDDKQMNPYESEIKDGYLIFETNHFSNWALIGDYVANYTETTSSRLLKVSLLLLVISAGALISIAFVRNRKKQSLVVYSENNKKGGRKD